MRWISRFRALRSTFYYRLTGISSWTAKLIAADRIILGAGTRILPGALLSGSGGTLKLGSDCYVDRFAMISCHGGSIEIGNHCPVNPFCILYGHGGLKIGNDVRIAAHTIIIPANHGYSDKNVKICDQEMTKKGIVIGNNIWIGAGVTILDDITVGDGCIIGAGSVVTKSLEPYCVAAGVPAKVIQSR